MEIDINLKVIKEAEISLRVKLFNRTKTGKTPLIVYYKRLKLKNGGHLVAAEM